MDSPQHALLTCIAVKQQSVVVVDSTCQIDSGDRERRKKSLLMIQHILAVYGAATATTTVAFLVFCWRAVEVPYND